jgi:hypothetical protein
VKRTKLVLFLVVPVVGFLALLIYRFHATSQVGRFLPVQDGEMRRYGIVFDTTTGKNCSIHSFNKDVQELRQTYLNRKAGKPVGHDESVRFDVFKEHLDSDAEAYNAQAYYVIFGNCPR